MHKKHASEGSSVCITPLVLVQKIGYRETRMSYEEDETLMTGNEVVG